MVDSSKTQQKKTTGKAAGHEFNDKSGANDNNQARAMTIPEAQAAVHRALPSLASGVLKLGRESITPTENQKKLMYQMQHKPIVFVNGPAGTGKTLFTCYTALEGFAEGKYDRICMAAPIVEADENMGFLPGDLNQKAMPHVLQIVETIDELIGKPLREKLMQSGAIEIAPHAFNRGRTYKYSFYILDESQNASARQLWTSFTRLGTGSTFAYLGDDVQNDRTVMKRTAFTAYMERFANEAYANDIGQITMSKSESRRHPLVRKMLERNEDRPLEGFENREDSKINATVKKQQSAQPQ